MKNFFKAKYEPVNLNEQHVIIDIHDNNNNNNNNKSTNTLINENKEKAFDFRSINEYHSIYNYKKNDNKKGYSVSSGKFLFLFMKLF
jgi:zona occludens toxin (predicted ATPase)